MGRKGVHKSTDEQKAERDAALESEPVILSPFVRFMRLLDALGIKSKLGPGGDWIRKDK